MCIGGKMEITEINNFCRIFELPIEYPSDFCFGGGHLVQFQMVDWFNPVPPTDFPNFGGTLKKWDEYVPMLKEFLGDKNYVKSNRKYILITDFGESFLFGKNT